jgi:hypothetical protein
MEHPNYKKKGVFKEHTWQTKLSSQILILYWENLKDVNLPYYYLPIRSYTY